MRRLILGAVLLGLAACGARVPARAPAIDPPPARAPVATPDAPVSSPANEGPRPVYVPPLRADASDPCGATALAWLIGKPRSEVPAAPAGAVWRVYSTTDAVTEDYNPARLNVMWDAGTGMVVEVKCG